MRRSLAEHGRHQLAFGVAVVGEHTVLIQAADLVVIQHPIVPAFQSFTMHNALIVADGQTVQYASATDPGNGMVTKVDLTLTVLK